MINITKLFIFFLMSFLLFTVGCTTSYLDGDYNNPQPRSVLDTIYCKLFSVCEITLYYGEMWFHNDSASGVLNPISQVGVYINITGFNQPSESGQDLNGFVYNDTEEFLSCLVEGKYDVTYDISTGNTGNNQEYIFAIGINGEPQDSSESHRKIGVAGDVGDAGDRAFFNCSLGDRYTLMAVNVDGTADLQVHAASINMVRIGVRT